MILRRRASDGFEVLLVEDVLRAARPASVPQASLDRVKHRVMSALGPQDERGTVLPKVVRERWILVPSGVGLAAAIAAAVRVVNTEPAGVEIPVHEGAQLASGRILVDGRQVMAVRPGQRVVAEGTAWLELSDLARVGLEDGSAVRLLAAGEGVVLESGAITVSAESPIEVRGDQWVASLAADSVARFAPLTEALLIDVYEGSVDLLVGGEDSYQFSKGESGVVMFGQAETPVPAGNGALPPRAITPSEAVLPAEPVLGVPALGQAEPGEGVAPSNGAGQPPADAIPAAPPAAAIERPAAGVPEQPEVEPAPPAGEPADTGPEVDTQPHGGSVGSPGDDVLPLAAGEPPAPTNEQPAGPSAAADTLDNGQDEEPAPQTGPGKPAAAGPPSQPPGHGANGAQQGPPEHAQSKAAPQAGGAGGGASQASDDGHGAAGAGQGQQQGAQGGVNAASAGKGVPASANGSEGKSGAQAKGPAGPSSSAAVSNGPPEHAQKPEAPGGGQKDAGASAKEVPSVVGVFHPGRSEGKGQNKAAEHSSEDAQAALDEASKAETDGGPKDDDAGAGDTSQNPGLHGSNAKDGAAGDNPGLEQAASVASGKASLGSGKEHPGGEAKDSADEPQMSVGKGPGAAGKGSSQGGKQAQK